jgi:hypothetical protein
VYLFEERLSPAWWLVLALFISVPTSVLIFLPLNLALGVAVGVAIWLGLVGLLWWGSPTVRVDEESFSAGRAHIARRYITKIEPIDDDGARAAKGVDLDARAFLVMRPWITPVVRVHLDDPRDPTPYWLVSTRHPETLAALINNHN